MTLCIRSMGILLTLLFPPNTVYLGTISLLKISTA